MTREALLRLYPANLARAFDLHSADVAEGVSVLYRIRLVLRERPVEGMALHLPPGALPDTTLFGDPWLGEELAAELRMEGEPRSRRLFHGVVSAYELDGSGARVLTLEPQLSLFSQRVRTRTFVRRHAGDVIREVLQECGVKFKFDEKLPKIPLLTQYRESDAAFVVRLIARFGLCFVFEHHTDGHVMVIGGSPRLHLSPTAKPVSPQFRSDLTANDLTPAVLRWGPRRAFRPGRFEQQAVAAATPDRVTKTTANATHAGPRERTITRSAPAPTVWPDDPPPPEGQPDWGRTVIDAGGTQLVRPGELVVGPAVGSENQFTILTVRHSAQSGLIGNTAGYFNTFTAVPRTAGPGAAGFMPDLPPRPGVGGPSYATVVESDGRVGKPGKLALTAGRVWIRIDEDTAPNPAVPVRLATGLPHSYGPPRVGQRVVVDYEDGDPDRPVVVAIAPVPAADALPHDPDRRPAAYTLRFPPAVPTGNKDDDAVFQADAAAGRVAVQAPGGLFARARKLLSLIGLGGLFARGKTITLTADDELILSAGSKVTIRVGGSVLVITDSDIAVNPAGTLYLAGGGPTGSNASGPDDDGRPH